MSRKQPFAQWIDVLETEVIQGDFGYEPGEFTVYHEHWRPLWRDGLTPQAAWRRALDARATQRVLDDEARAENWRRIQREDAALIAATPPSSGEG